MFGLICNFRRAGIPFLGRIGRLWAAINVFFHGQGCRAGINLCRFFFHAADFNFAGYRAFEGVFGFAGI